MMSARHPNAGAHMDFPIQTRVVIRVRLPTTGNTRILSALTPMIASGPGNGSSKHKCLDIQCPSAGTAKAVQEAEKERSPNGGNVRRKEQNVIAPLDPATWVPGNHHTRADDVKIIANNVTSFIARSNYGCCSALAACMPWRVASTSHM
jgi:hypothetical protein